MFASEAAADNFKRQIKENPMKPGFLAPEKQAEKPLQPLLARDAKNSAEFFSVTAPGCWLKPLRAIDRQEYIIRILTWKRTSFLAATVALHSQCPGVAQIQVVWSSLRGEGQHTTLDNQQELKQIPKAVIDNPKVYIEKEPQIG